MLLTTKPISPACRMIVGLFQDRENILGNIKQLVFWAFFRPLFLRKFLKCSINIFQQA